MSEHLYIETIPKKLLSYLFETTRSTQETFELSASLFLLHFERFLQGIAFNVWRRVKNIFTYMHFLCFSDEISTILAASALNLLNFTLTAISKLYLTATCLHIGGFSIL